MDSNDLRDSLFNTINLLNDMEAGVQTPPRDKNKEVELSATFVDGIKEKLVNPNKALDKQSSEQFNELQVLLEKQLVEVHKALQSQARVITALKDEINTLKDQRQVPEKPFERSFQPQRPSFESQEEKPSFGEQQQMLHQQETVQVSFDNDDSFIGQQHSEPVQQQNQPAQPEPFAVERSEPIHQPQEPMPQKPMPQQVQQPVQQQSSAPKEANPRVGNYNSNDVSIEKYFYFGNK